MNSGKIVTQGTPREVFSQVELLKRYKLDVPQATELMYRLRGAGIDVPADILDSESCIECLSLLRKKEA